MSPFDTPVATRPRADFLDLLQAESLKLRRSLILGLALLFPLGLLTIALLVGFLMPLENRATWRTWMTYALLPWSSFLLPMLVCLLSTLLLNLEHQNHLWKHLHALPIPRWKHLAAKQALLVLLLLLSHLLLFAGLWAEGWALRLARPACSFEAPSASAAIALFGLTFLASWAMAAVHAWLALRFPNLGVNLGAGLGGVMLVAVVAQHPALARLFPWAMASSGLGDWMAGPGASASPWTSAGLSVVLSGIVAGLACRDAQRRESQG